ncbi:MAG: HDOD domain-containing protein [Desulfamplus sp.]|nr:HDOD domain-containing protein [Desulfamplus sp.]
MTQEKAIKILIVEDEPVSRTKIAKMLDDVGTLELFEAGKDALEAFIKAFEAKSPFNFLILDVSMPEMDGIELLKKIRKFEKQSLVPRESASKIVMLTSYSDKKTVIACHAAGCDDYAVKPFKKDVIIKKMEKLGFKPPQVKGSSSDEITISQMVSDAIEGFKHGKVDLPSLPFIVQDLQDLMNAPNASLSEMANIIKSDIAISIELIKAANSPYYGGVEKIKDVKMAINRLGLDKTRAVVSEIAGKSLFQIDIPVFKKAMDQLWRHSYAVAHISRIIAGKVWSVKPEQVFVKGLIHDVGATLLIKNIAENIKGINPGGKNVDQKGQKTKGSPEVHHAFNSGDDKCVDEVINCVMEVHASFGGTLLKTWKFGTDFVDVARLHEWKEFPGETSSEVLIVNLADQLSSSIGYAFHNREAPDLSLIHSASLLGIENDELARICETAKHEIEQALNIMEQETDKA